MKFNDITAINDDQARDYLEFIRWPNGPVCSHCGSKEATKLQGKSTRPGVYKCKSKECRKQFTVTVGTIFERSHVALRHWVMAFHLMCASKKGISAHQLHRMIGVTYKTAWFICHRIRHAMQHGLTETKMTGTVEVDETYVGGKPRPGTSSRGRGTKKTPVVALVGREGSVRATVVPRLTAKNLGAYIKENVDQSATLMTDEFKSYTKVGREFAEHHRIKHKEGIYAMPGGVHTNTVEGFFSILKRGVHGTFHHVSPKHLQRYVDEFGFRYNTRKASDETRTAAALQGAEGKRLMYR